MRCVVTCLVCGACGPTVAVGDGEVPVVEDTGVACAHGPEGPMGPPGPAGPPGAEGPPAPVQYHWVDAIDAVVTESTELIWIDPGTEYVWEIDSETGEYQSGSELMQNRWYDNVNCTGTGWVLSHPPRVPFRLDGSGTTYYVRPDWLPSESIQSSAILLGSTGTCLAWSLPLTSGMSEDLLISTGLVAPPPSQWVGPLRQVL